MFGFKFFTIVHQQTASIVERFGRYHRTLGPGLHFLVPIMDHISYRHLLKEESISIEQQSAITKDNVTVMIEGALFVRILDPYKVSYCVERPHESVKLLALTVLRSEIGKMRMDKLFQDRKELNEAINIAVNNSCQNWGIKCIRYEILNIDPPKEIKTTMQFEAEAERLKRRDVLISEGKQLAEINFSLGKKISQIKQAEGEAESLKLVSEKEREGLLKIAKELENDNSEILQKYLLTQTYLENYKKALKRANVVVAPQDKGTNRNSETLTLAALLMLQGRSGYAYAGAQEYDNSLRAAYLKNQSEGGRMLEKKAQPAKGESPVNAAEDVYQDLVSRLEYYDEPLLYNNNDDHPNEKLDHSALHSDVQQSSQDGAQSQKHQYSKQQQQQQMYSGHHPNLYEKKEEKF